jgi:hypothetical protein
MKAPLRGEGKRMLFPLIPSSFLVVPVGEIFIVIGTTKNVLYWLDDPNIQTEEVLFNAAMTQPPSPIYVRFFLACILHSVCVVCRYTGHGAGGVECIPSSSYFGRKQA